MKGRALPSRNSSSLRFRAGRGPGEPEQEREWDGEKGDCGRGAGVSRDGACPCQHRGADLSVGVNDDAGKFEASELSWFYPTMASTGLAVNAITLRWDETAPTAVADEAVISQAIERAQASGITVELDIYPLRSQAFTNGAVRVVDRPRGMRQHGANQAVRGVGGDGRAHLPDRTRAWS